MSDDDEKSRRVKIKTEHNAVRFVVGKDDAHSFTVSFIRTLRIPDDGKTYDLPAGCGQFPVKRVEDYKDKVPAAWREHGGVFIPLWQREALWLSFNGTHASGHPWALKVAAGKINAVSGDKWEDDKLHTRIGDPAQDYLVSRPQPWLDGFNAGDGTIKQFVAMPLGMGYTVEGQVTGEETFGGIQLQAYPPTVEWLEARELAKRQDLERRAAVLRSNAKGGQHVNSTSGRSRITTASLHGGYKSGGASGQSAGGQSTGFSYEAEGPWGGEISASLDSFGAATMDFSEGPAAAAGMVSDDERGIVLSNAMPRAAEMGLAQGGRMTQKIYADPHGIATWDQSIRGGRVFVHIVNSEMWKQITGEEVPPSPITKEMYTRAGYKWFDLYDEGVPSVGGSAVLSGVKSVAQKDKEHGFVGQMDNQSIEVKDTVKLKVQVDDKAEVTDGKW